LRKNEKEKLPGKFCSICSNLVPWEQHDTNFNYLDVGQNYSSDKSDDPYVANVTNKVKQKTKILLLSNNL